MKKIQTILLFGNTCSGKSTLGKLLQQVYGIQYLCFGDLKRKHIAMNTAIGRTLCEQISRRVPIDPDLGMQLLSMSKEEHTRCVCGYPISTKELECFEKLHAVLGAIHLIVPDDVVMQRFANRAQCPQCDWPGLESDICPMHHIQLEKRIDAIQNELDARMKLYHNRIEPFVRTNIAVKFPLFSIHSSGVDKNTVFKNVLERLISLKISLRERQ